MLVQWLASAPMKKLLVFLPIAVCTLGMTLAGGCASGEEDMSEQDQTNADAEPALTDDEMELEENPGGEGEGE